MLSKPATMLLGLIYEKPLNAYEITKLLGYMNVRWWFNIADSTVYTTIKNLEKKGFIEGETEKVGNMPDCQRRERVSGSNKKSHSAI